MQVRGTQMEDKMYAQMEEGMTNPGKCMLWQLSKLICGKNTFDSSKSLSCLCKTSGKIRTCEEVWLLFTGGKTQMKWFHSAPTINSIPFNFNHHYLLTVHHSEKSVEKKQQKCPNCVHREKCQNTHFNCFSSINVIFTVSICSCETMPSMPTSTPSKLSFTFGKCRCLPCWDWPGGVDEILPRRGLSTLREWISDGQYDRVRTVGTNKLLFSFGETFPNTLVLLKVLGMNTQAGDVVEGQGCLSCCPTCTAIRRSRH